MKISLIVAMDSNRVIGKANDIPWRIPKDWEFVEKITTGHSIVLGRKNLESIGRALPNRRNIILTRDKSFTFDGCEMAYSIEDVFKLCENDEELFIFGGEQIYTIFLPYVEKMYMTKFIMNLKEIHFFQKFNSMNGMKSLWKKELGMRKIHMTTIFVFLKEKNERVPKPH